VVINGVNPIRQAWRHPIYMSVLYETLVQPSRFYLYARSNLTEAVDPKLGCIYYYPKFSAQDVISFERTQIAIKPPFILRRVVNIVRFSAYRRPKPAVRLSAFDHWGIHNGSR
jgi:hypothetical protein